MTRMRFEHLVEELRCGRGDWSTALGRVPHRQVASADFTDYRAGLAADERGGQVIPDSVDAGRGAVDESVEDTGGYRAHVECGGAQGAELAPTEVSAGPRGQADERVRQLGSSGGHDWETVQRGAAAAAGEEAGAGGLVRDDGEAGAVLVNDADCGGVPRDAAPRVGRPIERVDDREKRPIGVREPGFLREHTQPSRGKDLEGRRVGHEVREVLTRSGAGESPVVDPGQGSSNCIADLVEGGGQLLVVRGGDGGISHGEPKLPPGEINMESRRLSD